MIAQLLIFPVHGLWFSAWTVDGVAVKNQSDTCMCVQLLIVRRWLKDWLVVNQFLITDPTTRQPFFGLERKDWTLLNWYHTGHNWCAVTLYDWGIRDAPSCAYGSKQTMSHIVNECPLTRHPGGLHALHSADEDSITWLRKFSIC